MSEDPTQPATERPPRERADPNDDPVEPGTLPGSEGSTALQALLMSVEELRALLAPLTEQERHQVLELARRLRHPKPPAT